MTQVQQRGTASTTAVVEAWRIARAQEMQGVDPSLLTREQRMDLDRRAQVLDRVEEVVAQRLMQEPSVSTGPRVVLAHRQEWFGNKLRTALVERGVEVLDVVTDGAEAVGTAIALQPELVMVEAVLTRMSGIEVLRDIRRFVPGTRCVAQVAYEDGVRAMTEAGADAAWARKVSPAQVADGIVSLLSS